MLRQRALSRTTRGVVCRFTYLPRRLFSFMAKSNLDGKLSKRSEPLRLCIGNAIDTLCTARGWTYRHLAREAMVSPQTLCSILKGCSNVQLSTLTAIAAALGCELLVAFRMPARRGR